MTINWKHSFNNVSTYISVTFPVEDVSMDEQIAEWPLVAESVAAPGVWKGGMFPPLHELTMSIAK